MKHEISTKEKRRKTKTDTRSHQKQKQLPRSLKPARKMRSVM